MDSAPAPVTPPTDTFAEVARALAHRRGLDDTLQGIVELAVQTVPGADHAAVSLVQGRGRVETVATSDELPCAVDAAQYATGEGPCLEALWDREAVHTPDLAVTDRWPAFAPRAVELGVRSMLSFRLFAEADGTAGLNLYNGRPGAFDEQSVSVGHVFAVHAALAYEHAREVEGLRSALETRTLIGQAQGILMGRHRVRPDVAFDLLRTASQRRNVKLRDVAQQVVETGELA